IGTIERLSIRSTVVRTLNNVEFVIPNQIFFTTPFRTLTGADKSVRFSVSVRTSCDNDLQEVIRLLKETAVTHPEIMKDPAPDVWIQESFGDNVLDYQMMLWTEYPLRINPIKSEIIQSVWAVFAENNIGLTFPDLELHFNSSLRGSLHKGIA
ncbi:MAG: mechanosensitive ion channel, partial [Candidatus Scalindua sp.]|nr:mechanosensitive ion channel [Candidatus Scalindua sp.]